jgi:hypothetical protein
VPGFTQAEFEVAMALVARRNAELHSGIAGFENYPSRLWLTELFHICQLILRHLGRDLADLLGTDEATAADTMLAARQANIRLEVQTRIAEAGSDFGTLSTEEQEAHRARAITTAIPGPQELRFQCPACGSTGLIHGESIGADDVELDGDVLIVSRTLLPTRFACGACGLELRSYEELDAVELGGQHDKRDEWDPAEYYAPEIDQYLDEHAGWDEDYMND